MEVRILGGLAEQTCSLVLTLERALDLGPCCRTGNLNWKL